MRRVIAATCFLLLLAPLAGAGPFVSPGPFVPMVPGPHVPSPRNVPGKEYTNRVWFPAGTSRDWDDSAVIDDGQSLWFDGLAGITNAIDYDVYFPPGTQMDVDAQANGYDGLAYWLVQGKSALIFSTGSVGAPSAMDGYLMYEPVATGAGSADLPNNVWAAPDRIDQHYMAGDGLGSPFDINSVEIWGVDGPALADADAFMFSLRGDPFGVSVYNTAGGVLTTVFTQEDIYRALGYDPSSPDPDFAVADIDVDATIIDLDGYLYWSGDVLVSTGPVVLFSLMPVAASGGFAGFDGGEIWVWDGVTFGGATFLYHSGHYWDTAFDVMGTFGLDTENVDALEVVSTVPEPSTLALVGLGMLAIGGLACRRRRRAETSAPR